MTTNLAAAAPSVAATGYVTADVLVQHSAQLFLTVEAELLDDHRYRDWLGLLADEITYRAPVRTSRRTDGRIGTESNYWFDENRNMLELRVRRLETDVSWAEEPPSRTRRMVSNVRVVGELDGPETGTGGIRVRSNLLCHRNRRDSDTSDLIAAERHDHLVNEGGYWKLAQRVILLDHATLPTKNLAIFL